MCNSYRNSWIKWERLNCFHFVYDVIEGLGWISWGRGWSIWIWAKKVWNEKLTARMSDLYNFTLELLHQESKLSCVITFFKAEKVHLSFKDQNYFLKENNPWILNKWKSAARLLMLSRIILSSDGIGVLAHTKLVVWWAANFVSNVNISLCDTEIPQPREISGYTF